MHDVNREVRYISSKYIVQIDPLYVEWNKLIPTLENHFPDSLEELLNHDHQWHTLVHNHGHSIPASSRKLNTISDVVSQTGYKHKDHTALDFCN